MVGGALGEDDAGGRGEMRLEEVGQEEGAEEVDDVDGWQAVGSEVLTRRGGADAGVVKEMGDGEVKGRRPGVDGGVDGG